MNAREYMNSYIYRMHEKELCTTELDYLCEGALEMPLDDKPTAQKLETIAEVLWNDYGLLKEGFVAIESVRFSKGILRVVYLYGDREAYAKLKERTLANM